MVGIKNRIVWWREIGVWEGIIKNYPEVKNTYFNEKQPVLYLVLKLDEMFEKITKYSNVIGLGFILIGVAAFLPITYDVKWESHPEYEYEVTETLNFGLVTGIYFINLFLITIPLLFAFYANQIVANIFIILTGIFAFIVLIIGAQFSVFNWGGPFSGSTEFGIYFMYAGDIIVILGAFLANYQLVDDNSEIK